jgi:predicted alpha/beta-hydrolase family hydrolase
MANEPEQFTVKVTNTEAVTALLYLAPKSDRAKTTVVLGHGAGANQLSGFMRMFAIGLVARGVDVMTFNFIYMEQQRSVPDQKGKLESCFQAVIETALKQKKLAGNRLVIGGKSMGGRIASQVAAAACEEKTPLADQIDGLVFLGYPLHPPGNPEKLRVEHWPSIKMPMLFVQGTRDALGTTDELGPFTKQLKVPATIHAIEGGDHSFKAPKKLGLPQEQIYDRAMNAIVDWIKQL